MNIRKILLLQLLIGNLFLIPGCQPVVHKNMDIVSSGTGLNIDYNGLLKNPIWGIIANNMPNQVSPPNPCNFCPCKNTDPNAWKSATNCTGQEVSYVGEFTCGGNGHLNYFPVTYEGSIYFEDHSPSYADDDYNFILCRNDKALYTSVKPAGIMTEFDSDETVDYWDNTQTWWDNFHHNVVDESQDQAREALKGNYAIVIGLAGLDDEHGGFTELHPVYAMFIHVKDDPNDDKWAFFVRNWGNQGWCGDEDQLFRNDLTSENNKIRIVIPHDNTSDYTMIVNAWERNDDDSRPVNPNRMTEQKIEEGILLTFTLDKPEDHNFVMGDLTIRWRSNDPGKPLQPRNDFGLNPKGTPSSPSTSDTDTRYNYCSTLDEKYPNGGPVYERLKRICDIQSLDSASQQELSKKLKEIKPEAKNRRIVSRKLSSGSEKPIVNNNPDYSKMIYHVKDTFQKQEKDKKADFIKKYLKEKGIN
jgi:hypothetical protein